MFQGTVVSVKEGYGFIQCAERDARMFFHFSEILDPKVETKIQDEVEFTVTQVNHYNLLTFTQLTYIHTTYFHFTQLTFTLHNLLSLYTAKLYFTRVHMSEYKFQPHPVQSCTNPRGFEGHIKLDVFSYFTLYLFSFHQ